MKKSLASVMVLMGALTFPPAGQRAQSPAGPAADRSAAVVAAQQQDALQTLLFLKNGAGEIADVKERVRVLLEVADALWPADREQAREVFRQTLELAAAYEDSEAKTAGAALRQKVTTRIARRDPALARNLLKAFAPKPKEPTEDDTFGQLYGRDNPGTDVMLNAASDILTTDAGAATQMARFAAADGFTQGLRRFITGLRAQDPAAADALFEAVYRTASARRPKELSEALFIWDYAFQRGTIYLGPVAWLGEQRAPLPVSPEVRSRALAFAVAAILENVQQFNVAGPPEAESPLARERYVLIHSLVSQVLPDVEKFMPASLPLLQTHLSRMEQTLREWGRTPPSPPEPLPSSAAGEDDVNKWLDIASKVSKPEVRDGVYAKVALMLYLRGQYERALEAAGKIEGPALARQLTEPIRFDQAEALISRGELDAAVEVARALDAPATRAAVLARLGGAFFAAKKPGLAVGILGEAEESASKANPSAYAASALLAVALGYVGNDRPKAVSLTSAAIRTLNAVEGEEPWELLQSGGGGGSGRPSVQNPHWSTGRGGIVTSLVVTYPKPAGLLDVLTKVAAGDLNDGLTYARQIKSKNLSYAVQALLCRQAVERAQTIKKSAPKDKPRPH